MSYFSLLTNGLFQRVAALGAIPMAAVTQQWTGQTAYDIGDSVGGVRVLDFGGGMAGRPVELRTLHLWCAFTGGTPDIVWRLYEQSPTGTYTDGDPASHAAADNAFLVRAENAGRSNPAAPSNETGGVTRWALVSSSLPVQATCDASGKLYVVLVAAGAISGGGTTYTLRCEARA